MGPNQFLRWSAVTIAFVPTLPLGCTNEQRFERRRLVDRKRGAIVRAGGFGFGR